jgi:hypothetical protein
MNLALLCLLSTPALARADQVAYGEVWIIANRWGAYPAVLAGTIRNGEFRERPIASFPQYWEQAFDYRLLIGWSEQPITPPLAPETDWGYGVGDATDFYRRFKFSYLSRGFKKDWKAELNQILPNVPHPVTRTICLLNGDGTPLAHKIVELAVYGSSENHMGHPVGIRLGQFTTDAEGRIAVRTQLSPLAVYASYSEPVHRGPAGGAFVMHDDFITGSERDMTIRQWWSLPEYDYLVTLAPGRAGIRADGCLFEFSWGAGCGPITRSADNPVSDASGGLRFRARDLRELGQIILVDEAGTQHPLTTPEMRELLTTHRVVVRWTQQ